jgi:hypothetical protein
MEAFGPLRFGQSAIGQERGNASVRTYAGRQRRSEVALIEIVIVLIVVGVLLWLVNTYIPMASPVKSLLNAVVVIVLVIWLLQVFGVWHYITNIRVGS